MADLRFVRTIAALAVVAFLACPSPVQAEPLTMAHGWSVNPDGGAAAANEAIAMMQKHVQDPHFIVLYTTADYGVEAIAETLRAKFPDAKLFGISVYKGVFTSDGLHIGEKGSLAIMGFAGGDLAVGVAVREVPEGADARAVTKQALADAAEDAGRSLDEDPSVVLLGSMKGGEDAAVVGISELISQDVPLVGGTQCDDGFSEGYVIGNDKIYRPGIIVGLLYTPAKVGASFYSGFVGKRKSGVITSGAGRIIRQIDGRPAQEVYREWAEGYFDDIDASKQDTVVLSSAVCPLARGLRMPDGEVQHVLLQPWKFNADNSLTVGCDIHEGDTVYYVEGDKRALKKRAGATVTNAMVHGRIKIKELAGGLHIYCRGAAKTLGFEEGSEVDRMVAEIQRAMKKKPFIGGFTAGEQGNIPGYGFFHGNLMSSMVVFSE